MHNLVNKLMTPVMMSAMWAMPANAAPFLLPSFQATSSAAVLENLAVEVKRSHQLQLHQTMALGTLGLMAVETMLGIYSARDANASAWARPFHIALGGGIVSLYGASAALAYSVEPAQTDAAPDGITWHRWMSYGHFISLAATLGLGYWLSLPSSFRPAGLERETLEMAHGIMGGTTLSLMTLSLGALILEF
jgi:hypothetical protein